MGRRKGNAGGTRYRTLGGAGSGDRQITLFGDRERTRKEPLRRGETLFDFYDSCASHGYDEFRSVVNGWLAQIPADGRNNLITRMRYGGDREFGSSLCELSLHAFVLGSGCRANLHQEVPGTTKRPDMLRPTKQARYWPT